MRTAATRGVEAGLIGLLLFAPLGFGGNRPGPLFVLQVGTVVLLGTWLVARRLAPAPPPSRTRPPVLLPARLLLPFAAFLAVLAMQLIPLPVPLIRLVSPMRAELAALAAPQGHWATGSVYPLVTLRALLTWACWIGAFAVAYGATDTRGAAKRVAWAVILSGVFQALYGGGEFLTGRQEILGFPKLHYLDSATGTFVNRNHFAAYLALAFGVLWGLLRYYLGRSGRGVQRTAGRSERAALLAFLGVVLLVGIVLSGSRGGIAALASCALVFLAAWPLARGRRQTLAAAGVLVALVAVAVWWIGRAPLADRLATAGEDARTAGNRLGAWRVSLRMIADAPVLGGGGGTYRWRYPAYRTDPRGANFDHAHSDYLELATDAGVLGLACLVAGVGGVIAFILRRRRERESRLSRTLPAGGLFGTAAVLAHAAFDFPLQIPGIAFTLFAVLGWSAAVATRRLE